ncbi:MAG: ABC transporter ATP-binding protein [Synergistaceae bacterium]|nr:ABC transporter ATP-binding protein [Synergistaceae bacterium]
MNAVVARDLTRRFGSFTAVDHVCFSIPQGSVYGFLGPNGSGKTTTIRMLTGILEPTAGSAVILGLDIAGDRDAVKSRLGYMSQRFSLYDDLTVSENLEFYAGMFSLPRSVARGRIEEVVGMAGLSGRTRDLAGSLSGGIRQRLALGCAILHRPELLFLDEPTSGVDPVSRRRFWDIIYELAAGGTTIMVTTHFMDEAEHCDAIGFMFDGRLIASGTPRELKELLPGSSWELLSDHPMDLLEKLERRPGIVDASVHGRALHLQVESGWEDEVASMGANRIVPSLEDVFVHLVRKHRKERNS